LPDAFELMARVMRAGQTISQSLQAVADEFSAPVSEEFGYCYEQQNLGLSPEAAMRDLSARTGLLEMKIFVLAVMVHRQTGGNLADLLDKLGSIIRSRYQIRGKIKALTMEGRLQAVILLALPPFLFLAILFVNRPYATVLFQYPLLLIATCVSMTFGGIWMNRIINFDF
jgi:tight adherence protein B